MAANKFNVACLLLIHLQELYEDILSENGFAVLLSLRSRLKPRNTRLSLLEYDSFLFKDCRNSDITACCSLPSLCFAVVFPLEKQFLLNSLEQCFQGYSFGVAYVPLNR